MNPEALEMQQQVSTLTARRNSLQREIGELRRVYQAIVAANGHQEIQGNYREELLHLQCDHQALLRTHQVVKDDLRRALGTIEDYTAGDWVPLDRTNKYELGEFANTVRGLLVSRGHPKAETTINFIEGQVCARLHPTGAVMALSADMVRRGHVGCPRILADIFCAIHEIAP